MTDQCVVNKACISKLEKWRASTLSQVIENWENIDDDVKQEFSTVNDMYCGKHLVLNIQEYAGSALCKWERIEVEDGKIGCDKKLPWNHNKGESASLLTVRSEHIEDVLASHKSCLAIVPWPKNLKSY